MMKRTVIFLFVAVFSVVALCAQESRKTIYVIDGKQVENFDGSQLTGKTIVHYSVDPQLNIHNIITSDVTGGKTLKGVKVFATKKVIHKDANAPADTTEYIQAKEGEVVYVMDGKIVPYSDIKKLPSSKVDSMVVIKDKLSPDYLKYAKEAVRNRLSDYRKYDEGTVDIGKLAPKCIVKITTK